MNETGWKIKIEKSSILQNEILFLGFIISEKGIKADPERVKIYAEWETPTNSRQLISFLQSLQYYKKFVEGFARISAPLYDLTKKDAKFEWTQKHNDAFNQLKQRIIDHTHLQFPRVDQPYRLTTDWQPVAVSYTLEQQDENGIFQPIAFGGRKLSKSDAKLSSYDGELLAGYFAFMSLSRYLRAASVTGKENVWRTDNRAIEYAHKRKDIYGRTARILMFLDSFSYRVEHIAGKENPADPLSRQKERHELDEEEWERTDDLYDDDHHPLLLMTDAEAAAWAADIDEMLDRWEREEEEEQLKTATLWTIDEIDDEIDDDEVIFATFDALAGLAKCDDDDDVREIGEKYEKMNVHGAIGKEQDEDEEVRKVKEEVNGTNNVKEEEVKGRGKWFKSLYEKKKRMVVEDGILKWKWREDITNIDRKVVVVPSHMERRVIEDFHSLGHFGTKKLELTMRQHVWIYDLRDKVKRHVSSCEACQARSGPHRKQKLAMKSQVKGFFGEKIQMDLIAMQPSKKGNEKALTIVDVWSGFACAVALRNGTAKEVADALMKRWITIWGVPAEVQSDGGPEFTAALTVELCKQLEVVKIVNAPYSPFSTGKVEKLNKTLKDIIAKTTDDLRRWDENLEMVCFFYNASINLTTGFAPSELATGRKPTMPVSATFDAHRERETHVEYVDETMEKMREASRAVYEITRRNQATQRREFDKRVHGKALEVGDLVRVKFQGKPEVGVTTKLMSRWREPYEIVEKIGDKTYVVMMDYRGQMAPRVVNFRNMWKVGRKARNGQEAELEGFPDAEAYTDGRGAEMEENETETTEDDVEWDVMGSGDEEDDAGSDGAGRDDAEKDAEKDAERDGAGDDGGETPMDTTTPNGAETDAPIAEGARGEEMRAEAPTERLESGESRRGARGALNGDHLRMDRIFTRRGREVRPPKRLDL